MPYADERSEGKEGIILNMEKRPILIMGAMEVETDFLIEKIENKKQVVIAGYNFYEGTINSYPVVIAQTKVGVINGAAITMLAIEKYSPTCIISQGTAGGIGENIHTKDIVIGKEVFNIMSAKTPLKEINEGSDSTNWDYITFVAGMEDKKITQKADENLLTFFKGFENIYKQGKIHIGTIGSGDIWNREKDKIIYLNKVHGVLCEEMEGISIYTIANNNKIPVIGIRVISDNELLGEAYNRNLGEVCQQFVYEAVKKLIKKIEEIKI